MAITRTAHTLLPNPRRVIAKPYLPGQEIISGNNARTALLMDRILAIPEPEVASMLAGVLADFSSRHRGFEQILQRHFDLV
ncbi:MAG: glycosylase, partial [Gammaproteobacteria bacterium]